MAASPRRRTNGRRIATFHPELLEDFEIVIRSSREERIDGLFVSLLEIIARSRPPAASPGAHVASQVAAFFHGLDRCSCELPGPVLAPRSAKRERTRHSCEHFEGGDVLRHGRTVDIELVHSDTGGLAPRPEVQVFSQRRCVQQWTARHCWCSDECTGTAA